MSVAVAVRKKNEIVIGCDTQKNFGSLKIDIKNNRSEKLKKLGSSWLGSTGWGIYENLFDDYLKNKKRILLNSRGNIFSFFLSFYFKLKEEYHFVDEQCNEDENTPFADIDSSFLLINKNGIYAIASDLSVTEFNQYYAVGSGSDFAIGSIYSLYNTDMSAEDIVVKAVSASIALDKDCGGEVDLKKVRV